MNYKLRKVFKTISLVLLGLSVIGGIAALTTHLIKKDSVAVHPTFEVGGLNAQGRYEGVKGSLYTKEPFACEGLRATLDFDSQITYQIFYYDILDNFISTSEILSIGYSGVAPLNGAYARVVITPINDDDKKISFSEKLKYSKQLNLKVSKDAEGNVSKRFTSINGNCFELVNNLEDVNFVFGKKISNDFSIADSSKYSSTCYNFIDINNKRHLTFDKSVEATTGKAIRIYIFEFNTLPKDDVAYNLLTYTSWEMDSIDLSKDTKYVLIQVSSDDADLEALTPNLNKMIHLTKLN